MEKFLQKVAEFILNDVGKECLHTAVILPNKRSEIFLKDHLKKLVSGPFWLPGIYSVDEFLEKASGLAEQDPVALYFELFDIHREITGKEARSIDDFLAWAPVMLSDFNDIDLYLADPEKIFTHLSDIKAMEEWNPDGRELTPLQQNYLAFFRSLYQYYKQLNERLQKNGAGYKGMVYRYLFENIEKLSTGWPWKRFVLAGFNALSKAEKNIFGYIIQNYQTDIFWDLDEYYFQPGEKKQHEAGRFIHDLVKEWKVENIQWIGNHLLNDDDKEITLLGIPKNIGQVKFAGQQIETWFKNDKTIVEKQSFSETAIVLADEELLLPLLNSLPTIKTENGNTIGYNVTMGYPLTDSPFTDLANQWLNLLIQHNEQSNRNYSVYYLLSLIGNPAFQFTFEGISKGMPRMLTENLNRLNSVYLSFDQVMDQFPDADEKSGDLMEIILNAGKSPMTFISAFITFLQSSKQVIDESGHKNDLLREQMAITMNLVKKLDILLQDNAGLLTLKAVQNIFNQLIRRTGINLKGEPLEGIQVMGMLETRNLDFKNIILLSANDGILPKTSNLESFIPFDIRSVYHLPLPKDKSDVYAYHFYRLLQRARNVIVVYNSEPGDLGGGEKSRFILQIEKELAPANKKLRVLNKALSIPFNASNKEEHITIPKTNEILNLIRKKLKSGISPTALSVYISCPLKFYFRYVLGLKAPDSIDESIEADVFGTVVHHVLQDIYSGAKGKPITVDFLKVQLKRTDDLLLKGFAEKYPGGDINSGKNLLILKVAGKYVRRFIHLEIDELKRKNRYLIATEQVLQHQLDVEGETILLKGTIDRSDKINGAGMVRIIDYKTGAVDQTNLNLKEWDKLITEPNMAKAFQVFFYAYLFAKNNEDIRQIEAGIYSLRKLSQRFIRLTLPDSDNLSESFPRFEEQLSSLIRNMLDPTETMHQTDDEDQCKWCDFKEICNR